jgi:exodeoxyribonuclease VII large subunit
MTTADKRSIKKLSELNLEVQSVIRGHFTENTWIVAEISEIKMNATGHCYLELIEKDPSSEKILAKARANIWAFTFRMLKPYFESATGYELKQGIKILICVRVEFHEVYGYSLNITDIDPTYTIGDIERKRQEIIARLQKEGVFRMNKELALSPVPQKIAIISSETAAGYRDFIDQLDHNPYGYIFYHHLFPGIMQGDQAEPSIIKAFETIYPYADFFDAVVIIRGGGSKSDLSAFDNYNIAYYITQFPVPVLTGIGHEQDETITDMVAHTRLKTPTAVAEFLIGKVNDFEFLLVQSERKLERIVGSLLSLYHQNISSVQQRIVSVITIKMHSHSDKLFHLSDKIRSAASGFLDKLNLKYQQYIRNFMPAVKNCMSMHSMELERIIISLENKIEKLLESNHKQLELLSQRNSDLDPEKIFKRGFSITLYKGEPVKKSSQVNQGELIETRLHEGRLTSEIMDINE